MDTVLDLIRKQEQDYTTGSTKISEHVDFSVKDNVDKIDAYLNSKHISGEKDSLGRDKPFFNIVTAAVNVWYRATDIDRANIRIKSTKSSSHTIAMLANIKSKEWMRKAQFGVFLNEWGRTLARYGSAVCKFVEQDGKLIATVVPWNRLIIDAIDFENNPVIEKHFYTPAQLRKNKLFDQEQVEALIAQAQSSRELSGGEKVDTKNDYLEVYELHGELPLSYLTDNENDEDKYVQQVHICSFDTDENGEYLDYTLYAGREKNPYMITHLIKEDGRAMSIGAVEHLFEAQWMVNHNEKAIKDQLDLASKIILQTSDPAYQGKNTGDLDTGSILYHEGNQPLTRLETTPDITASLNSKANWVNNANEQVSTPDAMKGNTMPSGTAARQVEMLQQEGHSLFELMTENKGLALEDMWRSYVIPHIKKQLDTKEEIVAVLDDAGVKQIDAIYLPNEAKRRENERIKKEMFKLAKSDITEDVPFPAQPDMEASTAQVTEELQGLGNQRYFSPDGVSWKAVFKDFEWDVEVEVTNEQNDKLSTLTTLTTVLKELAGMGDAQNARIVLNKILEETGVFSPMELMTAQATPAPQPEPTPQPPA